MLVIDRNGRVAYTSRPNWVNLSITDSLVSQSETNDADFQAVVNCFRNGQDNCVLLESNDFQFRSSSFTVVRPIEMPRQDLGLGPERMLLLVNYDPGVVLVEFSQDLIAFVLIGASTAALLTLIVWLLLSHRLLPRLMEASHTDGLTQLMNRNLFMEQAKELLAEAEERRGDLVFAILDLDHFKRINDTFGHSCGDEALVHVGEILRTVTRPNDLVCRFGGEEFALLIQGSREAASKALERLRLQLEMSRLNFAGHHLTLHTSVGAAATADCGYNIDYLYTTADKALYSAKQGGRNRVAWSDGRMLSRLSR
jgi:diguanylate cyclase (GGDEF)-like protein